MELLAPAGSLETFHAAIASGADAVYLGLNQLNARLRARNFTTKTLSYLVPYAHGLGRKVYVALNTVVKQAELEPACHILHQLDQIGVDALIVADLGLARMARKHFPNLDLHASTQMFFHNSMAPIQARKLGFKRIILARELSLQELEPITRQKDVQYEVFVHGSLCYSFSGLCLASSFLGGSSGNRGKCTQVCRRQFTRRKTGERAPFFSPLDLNAADFVDRLGKLGVASLKIEGRLRGVEYVTTVVSAYRRILDNPDQLADVRDDLVNDMGRGKTTFFLSGALETSPLTGNSFAGTGHFAGTIGTVSNDVCALTTDTPLATGDNVRIHPANGNPAFRATLVSVSADGPVTNLGIRTERTVCPGDGLYLLRNRKTAKTASVPDMSAVRPIPFKSHCHFATKVLSRYHKRRERQALDNQELWLRIDTPGWLRAANAKEWNCIVLKLDHNGIGKVLSNRPLLARWRGKVVFEFPYFIAESDLPQWRRDTGRLRKAGVTHFICQHISQIALTLPRDRVIAGTHLWCMNRAAQQELADFGFGLFMHSPEDDVTNMGAMGSKAGIAMVFGHMPLFISRISNEFQSSELFSDDRDARFRLEKRTGLSIVTSEQPLCLFSQKEKLLRSGWQRFCIDLSFVAPSAEYLTGVRTLWSESKDLKNSSAFNFRTGLK